MEYIQSFFGYNQPLKPIYPPLDGLTRAKAIASTAIYNYKEDMPNIISQDNAVKIPIEAGQTGSGQRCLFVYPRGPNYDGLNNCQLKLYFENNLPIGIEPKDLIRKIELEIGADRIDRLTSHQLEPMLARLGLHWIVNDNCLTLPLPFDLFYGHNYLPISEITHNRVAILLQFQDYSKDLHIKEGYIEADYFKLAHIPPICHHRKNLTHVYQTQFSGEEVFQPVNTTYKTCIYFNHNIRLLYFYFTNENNQLIPLEFDHIELQFNGQKRFESNHAQLIKTATECFSNVVANKGYYCLCLCGQNLDTPIAEQEQIDFSQIDTIVLAITGYKMPCIENIQINICGLNDHVVVYKVGVVSNLETHNLWPNI
jgi:hypothetical protein